MIISKYICYCNWHYFFFWLSNIIYYIIYIYVYIFVHGEGNGTPLQYSCLENPMDRGA